MKSFLEEYGITVVVATIILGLIGVAAVFRVQGRNNIEYIVSGFGCKCGFHDCDYSNPEWNMEDVEHITVTYTCNDCGESVTETPSIRHFDKKGTRTYIAESHGNVNSKEVALKYAVTYNGEDKGLYDYNVLIELTSSEKSDWFLNGEPFAIGTTVVKFYIRTDSNITSTPTTKSNEACFLASLDYMGINSEGKYFYQAALVWQLPSSYNITNAKFYRLGSETNISYTSDKLMAEGKVANITGRNQYFLYTGNINNANNPYYNALFIVEYTDNNNVEHTYSSGVIQSHAN